MSRRRSDRSREIQESRDSRRRSARFGRLWQIIVVLILLGAAWWYQEKFGPGGSAASSPDPTEPGRSQSGSTPALEAVSSRKINGYDELRGCRLIDHRNNDGDSFFVRHGNREMEARLYYVDTAEKYLSDRHESQRRRVAEQAREFGNGITIDQTVELGQKAKAHTLGLLKGRTFTVFTKWEQVFDGERYYAFVQLPGEKRYLSAELIEQGLARIHTKGETTPDNYSYHQYKSHLEALERKARSEGAGAWGLSR